MRFGIYNYFCYINIILLTRTFPSCARSSWMLILTLSRVVCHFSGAWCSSASSFSMSCSTNNNHERWQMWRTIQQTNRIKLWTFWWQTSYSEELGDSVRLGAAHAAVTRPHDPPLAVGDGVRLLRAVRPHSHHPPVVTRPRGQSLIREEVPFIQAGDADGRLQGHLQNRNVLMRIRRNLMVSYM